MPHLLASGVSARAVAQAAARAGWMTTVLDAFGDRDCPGTVCPVTPFTSRRVVHLARGLAAEAVAVASGWEHAPGALAQFAAGRERLAASPEAIRAVRQPVRVARLLRAAGLPALVTSAAGRTSPPYRELHRAAAQDIRAWTRHRYGGAPAVDAAVSLWSAVVKPLRSGGGRGIEPFVEAPLPASCGRYLQEWREGTSVSLIMAADGRRGVPLALTRQYAGEARLGASGTTYAGSSISAGGAAEPGVAFGDARLRGQCDALADVLARDCGLSGLVGVDGIVDADGVFWLLEINPRWCASFELLDLLLGTPLFALHAAACRGVLPDAWLTDAGAPRAAAKGVLYRDAANACDTAPHLPDHLASRVRLADIPHAGTALPLGAPICSLVSAGPSGPACWDAVLEGAAEVRSRLADSAPERRVTSARRA